MTKMRILISLLAGAAMGALLIAGWYLFGQLVVHDFDYVLKYGARNVFAMFLMAFGIWLAGLVLFGAPIWLLLHRIKKRSWYHAVLLGITVSFVLWIYSISPHFLPVGTSTFSSADSGGPLWVNNRLTVHGWAQKMIELLVGFAYFAVVALTVWRVAYRTGGEKK